MNYLVNRYIEKLAMKGAVPKPVAAPNAGKAGKPGFLKNLLRSHKAPKPAQPTFDTETQMIPRPARWAPRGGGATLE